MVDYLGDLRPPTHLRSVYHVSRFAPPLAFSGWHLLRHPCWGHVSRFCLLLAVLAGSPLESLSEPRIVFVALCRQNRPPPLLLTHHQPFLTPILRRTRFFTSFFSAALTRLATLAEFSERIGRRGGHVKGLLPSRVLFCHTVPPNFPCKSANASTLLPGVRGFSVRRTTFACVAPSVCQILFSRALCPSIFLLFCRGQLAVDAP